MGLVDNWRLRKANYSGHYEKLSLAKSLFVRIWPLKRRRIRTKWIRVEGGYGERREKEIKKIQGAKILVVDDELFTCSILSQILNSKGHKVTTAKDGYQAIEEERKSPFDIMFKHRNLNSYTDGHR